MSSFWLKKNEIHKQESMAHTLGKNEYTETVPEGV